MDLAVYTQSILTVGLIIILVLLARGKREFFFDKVADVKAVRKI